MIYSYIFYNVYNIYNIFYNVSYIYRTSPPHSEKSSRKFKEVCSSQGSLVSPNFVSPGSRFFTAGGKDVSSPAFVSINLGRSSSVSPDGEEDISLCKNSRNHRQKNIQKLNRDPRGYKHNNDYNDYMRKGCEPNYDQNDQIQPEKEVFRTENNDSEEDKDVSKAEREDNKFEKDGLSLVRGESNRSIGERSKNVTGDSNRSELPFQKRAGSRKLLDLRRLSDIFTRSVESQRQTFGDVEGGFFSSLKVCFFLR